MNTQIGLGKDNMEEIVKLMCRILADEFVLYTKTLNAHWNIEGTDFYNKHLFFEIQYIELAETIDTIAERIRSLGHYAPATLSAYLRLTQLTELSGQNNDGIGFIQVLLADHIAIIISLREFSLILSSANRDAGTLDFITTLIEKHEKMAWKLRAHVQ